MKEVALLKSRGGASGGQEKYALRIAQAFRERGHRVTILTTGEGDSCEACRVAPWPPGLRIRQFDRFVERWLTTHSVDIVFSMDRNRSPTHIRAGNGVHAAYLKSRLHAEGAWKRWSSLINPLHRTILRLEKLSFESPRLQKLFANSHMVRRQILEHYATDPTKVEVVHNGVEWGEMAADFAAWPDARREPDCFHFLFIGSGYARKGLDRLLEALARIPRKDVHLSIVGKDNRMESFAARARALGIADRVRFFGAQRHIRPFYQIADALVIPSFYDPFANVTLEALAMGLFVVSSRHNGGAEVLQEGCGAIIDDLLDVESICAALQQALAQPKTPASAERIRQSVAHLDFSRQLQTLIEACL